MVLILLIFQLVSQSGESNLMSIALYALPLYLLSCYTMRQVYKTYLKKKHHMLR